MTIEKIINNDVAELHLSGKLIFLDGGDFREILNELFASNVKNIQIHLGELTFMDSAGLGMLMIAYKECDMRKIHLTVHNPRGDVKALMQLTKSYEKFNIIG